MKKELALHFLTTLCLFIPIFLLRFLNIHDFQANLAFLVFLVGGIIGVILPDIDHLIYIYYLRPQELTSQRVFYEIRKGNFAKSWDLLSTTRSERSHLIFHTVFFQILFIILSFLVVTSSSSLIGKGLVIAFLLHLLVDEVVDLRQTGNLANWFRQIPVQLDQIQLNVYLMTNFIIILVFGILM